MPASADARRGVPDSARRRLVGSGAAEAQNRAAPERSVFYLGPRPAGHYGCGEGLWRRRELVGVLGHRGGQAAFGVPTTVPLIWSTETVAVKTMVSGPAGGKLYFKVELEAG